MSKHTKGPWKFEKELTAHSGEWLVSMDAGGRGRGIGIAETRPGSGSEQANARLIAAAPELLEALQDVVTLAESAMLDAGKAGHDYYIDAELDDARAAIAKAKGDTK